MNFSCLNFAFLKPYILLLLQVLEREQIMNNYHEVTSQLEQALSRISYENLHISDEVKEQVRCHLQKFVLFSYLRHGYNQTAWSMLFSW